MKFYHVLESQQFTPELLLNLFSEADKLRESIKNGEVLDYLKGKILATLFYEPSTRTRLSFESAMSRLGGNVISTENARLFSSNAKGESLSDTIRVVGSYCDAVILRHFEDGAAQKASEVSSVPIINAGDGKGQHPTQALLDVYTIYREFGRLDNLRIAIVGDLASGRTSRSLSYLLGKFSGNEIVFVSPENLRMRGDIKDYLNNQSVRFKESDNLNEILPDVDIIYMTRIQKERISEEDYEKAKGKYVINENNFNLIKAESRLMHPLPHVEEINLDFNTEQGDKRVAYFRQAENGLYIRMALLKKILYNQE